MKSFRFSWGDRTKRKLSTLGRFRGSFVLKKRSRMRLQLVLCDDWQGNTGCLVAQDLALLTKVRTLIREEISLLTVLYFPFRARTPVRPTVQDGPGSTFSSDPPS